MAFFDDLDEIDKILEKANEKGAFISERQTEVALTLGDVVESFLCDNKWVQGSLLDGAWKDFWVEWKGVHL